MVKKNIIKKKLNKKVTISTIGHIHITSTFNNIIITLTNIKGEVVFWSSAGKMGFKGSKKNTSYAAQLVAESIAKEGVRLGVKKAHVSVKGPGAGRDTAIRTLSNLGIQIMVIKDVTPLPHNGCRPPKERRV